MERLNVAYTVITGDEKKHIYDTHCDPSGDIYQGPDFIGWKLDEFDYHYDDFFKFVLIF